MTISGQTQKCEVKYSYPNNSGVETVLSSANDDYLTVIARCKKQLSKKAPLPAGCSFFKIISRTPN